MTAGPYLLASKEPSPQVIAPTRAPAEGRGGQFGVRPLWGGHRRQSHHAERCAPRL